MVDRIDIEFRTAAGVLVRGWFFRPESAPGALPAVVAGEGMAGVKEIALDQIGREFARAGIATVAFDYPNFGTSDGAVRRLVDPEEQVETYRAAIAYAAGRDDVDAHRVGAWGASFAGGHVLRLASTQTPIACAVAVVPHLGVGWRQAVQGLNSPRKLAASLRRRTTVVTADPSEPALMCDPDGYRFLTQIISERAPHWENWIDSRSAPKILRYRPMARGADIRVPLLVIVADQDHITAPDRVGASLGGHPQVDIAHLPGRHFDIYGADHDQMVALSVEALRAGLGGGPT